MRFPGNTTSLGAAVSIVLTLLGPIQTVRAADKNDAGIEFFESKIRPVLVERCYKCHSGEGKKQKGGLALSTRESLRKGGDSGPAIVPGKPEASLLIKAIRHASAELKMPPDGKLPAAVIADFEKWIVLGAPDPREAGSTAGNAMHDPKKHWAYQPIRTPDLPPVKHKDWPISPVDHFILAKLEASGLTPAEPADRRTWIRRVYLDLTGLPPTFAEVETFIADSSADAPARLVDRLLASPHYGERWGRHWLDVARFADTKDGVLMYGDDRVRPYAYTYRDYVIRAFNEDMPFDRFIHDQLAADLVTPRVEKWRLAAMGFLTLGRQFDNNIHDVLDDRIDVVSRGLVGLTVACARCHDHKYDAISTADYYSLYGVFASSEAPLELPLIDRAEVFAGFTEFEKQYAPKRKQIQDFQDKQFALLSEAVRKRVGDYLLRVATTAPDPLETAIFFLSLAPEDLRPQIVARWRRYLSSPNRADDPVFGPWYELMNLPEMEVAKRAPAVLQEWKSRPLGTARGQVNPLLAGALTTAKLRNKGDVARAYGKLLAQVYEQSKKSASQSASDAERQLLDRVTGRDSPLYFPKSQTYYYMSRQEKDAFGGMKSGLDKLAVQAKNAPPRAMVLHDAPELYDPRVFVRGNPAVPGERVPRQFLEVLSNGKRRPFANGSGRLDLARAITAPDNPLTSRVMVNRVWLHHFGEPLVATPSDFGARSNPPSHPELLDYLAWQLQTDGWSLKKLHRAMVLSRTYQQSSRDRPECRKVDPENRLLWRCHRRRLDFESMRDTLLLMSGRLDRTMGGRPVDIVGNPLANRRTVYALVDRQSLPGMFRAFDFPVPDQSVERRPLTTVPQQALFGMNSPFAVEQAKALAARPEVTATSNAEQRITALYRLVFTRNPETDEVQAGLRFLQEVTSGQNGPDRSQLTAWQQYAQVLLLTNEVMFVD